MTPALNILHLKSNCKNGGHFDIPFSYLADFQCGVHLFSTQNRVRHPLEPLKWHPTWLYCALHPNCKNGGHIDLHLFYLDDLQCGVHLFSTQNRVRHPLEPLKWHPTWLHCALHPNCKNGGHIDLHLFYLDDLQCGVHLFSTQNRVRHPLEPLKWHPTWLHCALHPNYKKWRSHWPPLFLPKWPPVWFTLFFNPDLSQAP